MVNIWIASCSAYAPQFAMTNKKQHVIASGAKQTRVMIMDNENNKRKSGLLPASGKALAVRSSQ
ncbi:MAG: hypothetical protein LBP83_08805 [Dysgonamonadaceae bacterium]|jgi:hypothetical protein|nr:hypothetical protein [Dysgonamonadaceae bacterium]